MRATTLAGALLALAPLAAATDVTDPFTGGVNQGGWTFGATIEAIDPTGGNPDAWLHNSLIDTFAPQARTTTPGSAFLGDWRARGVVSFGADLRVVSTQFSYQREMTVMLSSGGLTVFRPGTENVPQVAEGWRSYDVAVDAASTTIPAGWEVLGGSADPDADWSAVVTSVTEVRIFFGHPEFFYIFDQWNVGLDNPRLVCASGVGTNYCTPTPNSTGQPALMSGSGSASVAANDLVLSAGPLQPATQGLFVYSPDAARMPLGNGILCVGDQTLGFVLRLPAETSDGAGVLTHAFDNTAPPHPAGLVTPGSTWRFTCWFRDPLAGGSMFDFADGLEITFAP